MKRDIGKIKWFSRDNQTGAIVSIGGTSLPFSLCDTGDDAAIFAEGQLVSYTSSLHESLGATAALVRPAAGRAT